jgi:hypothetical protein
MAFHLKAEAPDAAEPPYNEAATERDLSSWWSRARVNCSRVKSS